MKLETKDSKIPGIITSLCKQLEDQHSIKILFAIENGSRAWRMESKDSDYDVRFVFHRPLNDYLTISPKDDVIMAQFDEQGNPVKDNGIIDMSGFDIFKFCKLLSASNPTTIEWLETDIIYYGQQNKTFKSFAELHFDPAALFHHYKSLCMQNYTKYIKSGNHVTAKKYLYAFRGLVNALWVLHKPTVPSIRFQEAIDSLDTVLPKNIIKGIKEIIKSKSQGKEKDTINNIEEFDEYIESFLASNEVPESKKQKETRILDSEIQLILSK